MAPIKIVICTGVLLMLLQSLAFLIRDIATLRAGGALIDGEAGLGYTLTEDPALPPLPVVSRLAPLAPQG